MRARVAVAAALPLAAAGALAAALAAGGGEGSDDAAQPAAGGSAAEVVERRTLVESVTLDGTLGYDDPRPALDRRGGTLTWLPAAGATVRPGERLFAVDGEPVILLDGRVPAWRTMASGDEGADVRQLEANLQALGHDPGTVDDEFTWATAAAVRAWQEALGVEETGEVALGAVVFLPGARRVAEVTGSLGGGAGAGTGGGSAPAAWDGASGGLRTVAIVDTGGATVPAPTTTAPPPTTTAPAPGPRAPAGRGPAGRAPRPAGGARAGGAPAGRTPAGGAPRTGAPPTGGPPTGGPPTGGPAAGGPAAGGPAAGAAAAGGAGSGGAGGGDGGGAGAAAEVLRTTSTRRVVTADVDAADQGLARVGGRATVELPGGRRVGGRIVEVGTVATSAGGEEGDPGASEDATLPVTIELRGRAAGRLDEAPVVVELARTIRRRVVAVPVAALMARRGGGYAVRVVRGATTREVAVEPGLFADGWVELTGGGVRAGDRVEVPR